MLTFTKEQIKEIADDLDCGLKVFYHKETGELIIVPDTDKNFGMDTEEWQEDLDKLEENFMGYQEIRAMESRDSFRVMADFAEQLADEKLQSKLIHALNNKKPFSGFKFIIDNEDEQRQNWFAFKNKRYIEWTEEQLNLSNSRS
jgi:hypothetical protein